MDYPNENLIIYDGIFNLIWHEHKFSLQGQVRFKWFPSLAVCLYIKNFDYSIFNPFEADLILEVTSSSPRLKSNAFIARKPNNGDYNFCCYLLQPIEIGETRTQVDYVRFEISNLRDIIGIPVMNKKTGFLNRTVFENKESLITIDKYVNYSKLKQELIDTSGFQLLYTGKIELKNNEKITFQKTDYILESFSHFISFINGRRSSPLFWCGIENDEIKWQSLTPRLIDPYVYVHSWVSDWTNEGLSNLWNNFYELWRHESDQECLKTILHWYVEANSNTIFTEGSIVLIQNALELLFHWLIAEKLRYVNPNDADSLSASVKIGFLLSYFKISPSIPDQFTGLLKYSKKYNISSGPDIFTRIRNCIVHQSSKKRMTLKDLESIDRTEALHLGIWYVEMVLLRQLCFKGEYKNRCKSIKYQKDSEEIN